MAMVENRCSLLSLLPTALLFITASVSIVSGQSGVFLSLNGVNVPNDSYVLFDDIGIDATGLHCNTDRNDCCRGADHISGVPQGHWYCPNGSQVGSFTDEDTGPPRNFFSRNRFTGIVRLNRFGNPPERGRFRCEIPNAAGDTVTLYVNIVDMLPTTPPLTQPLMTTTNETPPPTTTAAPTTVTTTNETPSSPPTTTAPPTTVTINVAPITTSGTNTAGESYSLECTVTVTGSIDQPRIIWFDDNDAMISSTTTRMVSEITGSAGNYSTTLTFNPLAASRAGTYTCRARLDSAMDSASRTITVQNPTITVSIAPSVATPMVGSMYSLTCTVTGAESLTDAMVTYQWFKNGVVVSDQTMATLSFSPLTFSGAGNYTCEATVTSSLLSAPITTSSSNFVNDNLAIPIPTVMISSVPTTNTPNQTITSGSTVTLTCTVAMNQAVMESELSLLMVDTQLLKDGIVLSLSRPVISGTTFTYTNQLNSFERSDSGNYICRAAVRPQPGVSSYLTAASPVTSQTLGLISSDISVYLYLRGRIYFTNNGYVDIDDIGEGNNALLCNTDQVQCCRGMDTPSGVGAQGVWLYPDGTEVQIQGQDDDFYRNRGLSVVRLNRRNNARAPTGLYCCEVPDAANTQQRVCTNIVPEVPTTIEPPTVSQIPSSTMQASTPTSRNSSPAVTQQGRGPDPGVVAGAIIVVLLIVVAVIVAVLIVFFLWRRRSDKPYVSSSVKSRPTPPIAYSKTHNGNKITGLGGNNLKPQILKFPSDTNVIEGEGVYFKIKVSGEPQPTVSWYHDGEPVRADYAHEIEADGSLTISSTELKHSGVYKAVAANTHGSEEREIKLMINEEGRASTAVAIEDMVSSRSIPIPEFGEYVAKLHSNLNQPFKELYEALDSGEQGHMITYATDIPRKMFNRFGNIVVYDDNRIALQPLPGVDDCQDYINACYVDGYSIPNKFITTQGPLPKTVVDFWRLIWQERPPTIVMVTNVKEGTRIKCQQYWPESGKKDFGPFQVTITDQQIFADYTIRTLSISLISTGHSHKVTQYHFTAWPDHGVPDYATSILAFHRRVKAQHHPSRGPMVVHCSAGVGRTGTFVTIDNVLEQIEKEQVVDIPGAITKIRQRRMKMVQTDEQFTFIHDAILESVTCGDTQISATNLRSTLNRMKKKDPLNQLNAFEHQFQILEQVSPNPNEVVCIQAHRYSEKNRGDKYLPADRWRVVLKGERADYIHAVNINGYKQHKAFIIAQGPLKSTVRNFWKMIHDRKSAVILMLSELIEGGQEACTQYWPSSGTYQYGEYTVELMGEEPLEGFFIRDISVTDSRTRKAHRVTQFHITCWRPDGHCSNLKSITDVIEEMTKVQIRSGNKPIIVHCSDTVTRSGMFCAIATTIERCKTEGVVDVFQVVKALRVQKPGAVPTVSQYKTLFETVLVFLESFDTYANFQNI